MMKNVLVIVTFLLSAVLTGCGSNSKPDGGPNPALDEVLELQAQEILQAPNGTDFSLTMPFRKLIDETYHVELSGYTLEVDGGCMVSSSFDYDPSFKLEFDGGEGSTETLYISGAFDANCTPTGYTLTATQKITSGNLGDTRQVSFSYEYGSGSVNEGYSFYNATTPLTISETSTPYQIKVQLLKDGRIAEGETIELAPISGNDNGVYGEVADYSVVTGADGYGTFAYTSPETLPPSGSSKTLQVNYYEDNTSQASASREIVLNFLPKVASEYNLTNATTPIIVTANNQEKEISVYLVENSTWIGVEGKEISISTVSDGYGSIVDSYAVTDAAGKATFDYIGPEDLDAVAGMDDNLTLRFTENGITISKMVRLQMSPIITTDYNLTNAKTPVTVTDANQTQTIDIQLVLNGNPVIDSRPCTTDNTVTVDCVIPESIPRSYGRITEATSSPNFDGYIYFTYLSASQEDIDDVNDTDHNVTFYYIDEEGTVAAKTDITLEIRLP